MAEPGLSELVTAIQRRRSGELKDNITNNIPVLESMRAYDAIEEEEGGRTLVEETLFDENDTYIRYHGSQVLNTAYNPVMTAFEVDWKQFGIAVVINGREERMNGSTESKIKLLKGRIKAAEFTAQNNYEADLISDGTSDGGKQIGGLKLWISKTPTTGTIGGIDRSATAAAFARNYKLDTTTDSPANSVSTSAATIKKYLNNCINSTTRGSDRVKVLLAGQTHFEYLQEALQALQIITDTSTAKAGYKKLIYDGIPVVMGGGVSFGGQSQIQTDATYGINTRFTKIRVHKDANMTPLPEQMSINQDAKVKLMVWMGNMVCSAPKLNFVMFDS